MNSETDELAPPARSPQRYNRIADIPPACGSREHSQLAIPGKNCIILVIIFMTGLLFSECSREPSGRSGIILPETAGDWMLASRKTVTEDDIFDYMNGAGEIYLGYRFRGLEVYEYTTASGEDIIAEIYSMETSNDAFGLLSLDWGGEPVNLSVAPDPGNAISGVMTARALYGMGLLRLWAGLTYARIMAYRETDSSREAVLRLGEAIFADQEPTPYPEFLRYLPQELDSGWKLMQERVHYLRSYLVLNSLFYVSSHNVLGLDHGAESVLALYEKKDEPHKGLRIQVLMVRYDSRGKAAQAQKTFLKAFVPGKIFRDYHTEEDDNYIFNIEDGWLGCSLKDNNLNIVFSAPEKEIAAQALEIIKAHMPIP